MKDPCKKCKDNAICRGMACFEKLEYNMSLRSIRKHLSNNFEEFLPELLCYLMLHG